MTYSIKSISSARKYIDTQVSMWYTDIRHIKLECVSLIEKEVCYYENSGTSIYYLSMVCGFWMILPLIFGGIALSQMSKDRDLQQA